MCAADSSCLPAYAECNPVDLPFMLQTHYFNSSLATISLPTGAAEQIAASEYSGGAYGVGEAGQLPRSPSPSIGVAPVSLF